MNFRQVPNIEQTVWHIYVAFITLMLKMSDGLGMGIGFKAWITDKELWDASGRLWDDIATPLERLKNDIGTPLTDR